MYEKNLIIVCQNSQKLAKDITSRITYESLTGSIINMSIGKGVFNINKYL